MIVDLETLQMMCWQCKKVFYPQYGTVRAITDYYGCDCCDGPSRVEITCPHCKMVYSNGH